VTRTIDQLLDQARARLERLDAHQAAAVLGDGGLLIDIRPTAQRRERDARQRGRCSWQRRGSRAP
jgi:hypothetical protein